MHAVIAFAFAFLSVAAHAADDVELLSFNYVLRANVAYETGLYRVEGAPAAIKELVLKQRGTYCDLVIERVRYNTEQNGALKDATAQGNAVYGVAEGKVNAVTVAFHQESWDNATCELLVYGHGDGNTGGGSANEQLIGAISYGGGFVANASLALPATLGPVQSFRLAVPAFCQGVEVLSAGTVVANVFYQATPQRGVHNGFAVGRQGADASELRAALNGPRGAACDVPVFVTVAQGAYVTR